LLYSSFPQLIIFAVQQAVQTPVQTAVHTRRTLD
jgi:hypothetical protein